MMGTPPWTRSLAYFRAASKAALATASKKLSAIDIDVRVAIDRESGEYDTFRCWEVMEDDSEDFEDPDVLEYFIDYFFYASGIIFLVAPDGFYGAGYVIDQLRTAWLILKLNKCSVTKQIEIHKSKVMLFLLTSC